VSVMQMGLISLISFFILSFPPCFIIFYDTVDFVAQPAIFDRITVGDKV
jgi:hypothetical protein